jgi:hypothetical protein
MSGATAYGGRQVAADSDLQELSDPEFFTHWAAVRNFLSLTPAGKPEHSEVKHQYDAVAAEYRRRMDGAQREPISFDCWREQG